MSGKRALTSSSEKPLYVKHASKVLGSGNLRLAVRLPEGEDENEWLAVNTADFYTQTNMLYKTLSEFCTADSCPIMNSGEKCEYLWADGKKFKKPTRLPANEYVENLMNWIQGLLDNESLFPSKVGVAFPKNFQHEVKQICKRLFRVYAHIYYAHFEQILALKQEAHINTSFKHFLYFIQEFRLVDKKEIIPMASMVEALIGGSQG